MVARRECVPKRCVDRVAEALNCHGIKEELVVREWWDHLVKQQTANRREAVGGRLQMDRVEKGQGLGPMPDLVAVHKRVQQPVVSKPAMLAALATSAGTSSHPGRNEARSSRARRAIGCGQRRPSPSAARAVCPYSTNAGAVPFIKQEHSAGRSIPLSSALGTAHKASEACTCACSVADAIGKSACVPFRQTLVKVHTRQRRGSF